MDLIDGIRIGFRVVVRFEIEDRHGSRIDFLMLVGIRFMFCSKFYRECNVA